MSRRTLILFALGVVLLIAALFSLKIELTPKQEPEPEEPEPEPVNNKTDGTIQKESANTTADGE